MINDDLSDLTRTHEVIEQQARRLIADEQQVQQLIAIDHQRQQNFERYVQHHAFKELVDRRRLVRYISTGETDEGFEGVGVELAHQHIRKVIRLLREHDNFYLALSDERFESNFAVKPGYAVLLEKRTLDGEGQIEGIYAGIRDTDTGTVAIFTRRFEEAWNAVPFVYRDKRQVIGWLEARLAEAASGALDTSADEEAVELERFVSS